MITQRRQDARTQDRELIREKGARFLATLSLGVLALRERLAARPLGIIDLTVAVDGVIVRREEVSSYQNSSTTRSRLSSLEILSRQAQFCDDTLSRDVQISAFVCATFH